METIKPGDTGVAVEDVQHRLMLLGYLAQNEVTGVFDEKTACAVRDFCASVRIEAASEVSGKIWAALVDASYNLGDRTLYLRMPYFHGHDVLELQQALSALGFFCGNEDGIFGAHTEFALRRFQMNLGLPSDGIAGAYTFAALRNLQHSWAGKEPSHLNRPLGFVRAADVLETNELCLFGTCEFTRSVASRMSNLALATNPTSKIVSADALSVAPDEDMLMVHVSFDAENAYVEPFVPIVAYDDEETLAVRLKSAIGVARRNRAERGCADGIHKTDSAGEDGGFADAMDAESGSAAADVTDTDATDTDATDAAATDAACAPARIVVLLPGFSWEDAGADRSAQHFAITLLDAFCMALS